MSYNPKRKTKKESNDDPTMMVVVDDDMNYNPFASDSDSSPSSSDDEDGNNMNGSNRSGGMMNYLRRSMSTRSMSSDDLGGGLDISETSSSRLRRRSGNNNGGGGFGPPGSTSPLSPSPGQPAGRGSLKISPSALPFDNSRSGNSSLGLDISGSSRSLGSQSSRRSRNSTMSKAEAEELRAEMLMETLNDIHDKPSPASTSASAAEVGEPIGGNDKAVVGGDGEVGGNNKGVSSSRRSSQRSTTTGGGVWSSLRSSLRSSRNMAMSTAQADELRAEMLMDSLNNVNENMGESSRGANNNLAMSTGSGTQYDMNYVDDDGSIEEDNSIAAPLRSSSGGGESNGGGNTTSSTSRPSGLVRRDSKVSFRSSINMETGSVVSIGSATTFDSEYSFKADVKDVDDEDGKEGGDEERGAAAAAASVKNANNNNNNESRALTPPLPNYPTERATIATWGTTSNMETGSIVHRSSSIEYTRGSVSEYQRQVDDYESQVAAYNKKRASELRASARERASQASSSSSSSSSSSLANVRADMAAALVVAAAQDHGSSTTTATTTSHGGGMSSKTFKYRPMPKGSSSGGGSSKNSSGLLQQHGNNSMGVVQADDNASAHPTLANSKQQGNEENYQSQYLPRTHRTKSGTELFVYKQQKQKAPQAQKVQASQAYQPTGGARKSALKRSSYEDISESHRQDSNNDAMTSLMATAAVAAVAAGASTSADNDNNNCYYKSAAVTKGSNSKNVRSANKAKKNKKISSTPNNNNGSTRLSTVSKMYDLDGDGKLDAIEQAMRDADINNDGTLSNDEVIRIVQSQLKSQDDFRVYKKISLALLCLVAILSVCNFGTSFATAILSKDTVADSTSGTVQSKETGEVIGLQLSAFNYEIEELTDEEFRMRRNLVDEALLEDLDHEDHRHRRLGAYNWMNKNNDRNVKNKNKERKHCQCTKVAYDQGKIKHADLVEITRKCDGGNTVNIRRKWKNSYNSNDEEDFDYDTICGPGTVVVRKGKRKHNKKRNKVKVVDTKVTFRNKNGRKDKSVSFDCDNRGDCYVSGGALHQGLGHPCRLERDYDHDLGASECEPGLVCYDPDGETFGIGTCVSLQRYAKVDQVCDIDYGVNACTAEYACYTTETAVPTSYRNGNNKKKNKPTVTTIDVGSVRTGRCQRVIKRSTELQICDVSYGIDACANGYVCLGENGREIRRGLGLCYARSAVIVDDTPHRRWYVNYSLGTEGQCINDGNQENWDETFDTAESCCEQKLWWMKRGQCVPALWG